MVELASSHENVDVKKKESLMMTGKSLMAKPSMHNVSIQGAHISLLERSAQMNPDLSNKSQQAVAQHVNVSVEGQPFSTHNRSVQPSERFMAAKCDKSVQASAIKVIDCGVRYSKENQFGIYDEMDLTRYKSDGVAYNRLRDEYKDLKQLKQHCKDVLVKANESAVRTKACLLEAKEHIQYMPASEGTNAVNRYEIELVT